MAHRPACRGRGGSRCPVRDAPLARTAPSDWHSLPVLLQALRLALPTRPPAGSGPPRRWLSPSAWLFSLRPGWGLMQSSPLLLLVRETKSSEAPLGSLPRSQCHGFQGEKGQRGSCHPFPVSDRSVRPGGVCPRPLSRGEEEKPSTQPVGVGPPGPLHQAPHAPA